jgi:hypothetical protein
VLVGATAEATLGGAAKVEVAFRASLVWLLLLVPVGGVLGAAGGLLTRLDAFPTLHPYRAFLATSIAAAVVLLGSLPALAFSSGGTQPVAPLASEGQPFSSPPTSASPEPTTPSATSPPSEETPAPPGESEANSEADPAFDSLLSTLRQKTSAPIMLPAELPDELENVAVDADRGGEEYYLRLPEFGHHPIEFRWLGQKVPNIPYPTSRIHCRFIALSLNSSQLPRELARLGGGEETACQQKQTERPGKAQGHLGQR